MLQKRVALMKDGTRLAVVSVWLAAVSYVVFGYRFD